MNKKKLPKTNAIRLLEKAKIEYEIIPYKIDENDLSAVHTAKELGQDVKQLFKTLVLKGDKNGLFVCVIPGDAELDLKIAAKVSGNKKAEMLHMKDLLPTVGYLRGACTPIGMKKKLPTFINSSCLEYDYIFLSGGMRGIQIKINPKKIIEMSQAVVKTIIK